MLEYCEQNLRLAFIRFFHFSAFKIYVLLHVMGNVIKAVNNMMLSFICELFEKNQNLPSPLVK